MFRRRGGEVEVLLAHPGGPFWVKKDGGAWSIPKGEFAPEEDALEAARREFSEETGWAALGEFLPLGETRQSAGKTVAAWAFEGDADPATLRSNMFELEWPPRSGKRREFPEIDRVAWFTLPAAKHKILAAQQIFLDRLQLALRP